ncbi:hypothetical protein AB0E44_03125 [Micrococcus terreus]|uniref:PH-like domain-containing protein n=1 Tax=Micrococcus terreus TaxID=574650 RepID=UPI0033D8B99B
MTENAAASPLTLLTVAAIAALIFALIAWGWRNRKRRQQDLAAPAGVPQRVLDAEPLAGAEGMYVSTVRGRDWLDRIAVHGLGLRTTARLEVHPDGVALLRSGAENMFIPAADLTDVRLESGMQGKFVERDGLLVVSWMLGADEVSTGFRTRAAADRAPLMEAVQSLTGTATAAVPATPDPTDTTDR